jgi:hypothetical protein
MCGAHSTPEQWAVEPPKIVGERLSVAACSLTLLIKQTRRDIDREPQNSGVEQKTDQ